MITTGGNVNDISTALDLVDGIPPGAGHPAALLADTGYDSHRVHRELARRRRPERRNDKLLRQQAA